VKIWIVKSTGPIDSHSPRECTRQLKKKKKKKKEREMQPQHHGCPSKKHTNGMEMNEKIF